MGMHPSQEHSDNAGLFYTVFGLLPLGIYVSYFLPDVTNAEEQLLKKFVKAEIRVILLTPLIMLLCLGLLIVFEPPYTTFFTRIILLGSIWYQFPLMERRLETNNNDNDSVRASVMNKAIFVGYLVCQVSLYYIICALTGPDTFYFGGVMKGKFVYQFQTQNDPPEPRIRPVKDNGETVPVDMSRGYFTYILYTYAPESVFFLVMFYLSHFFLTLSYRWSFTFFVYLAFQTFTTFGRIYEWLR